MFNKALVKIFSVLVVLSMLLTATLFAYSTGVPAGDSSNVPSAESSSPAEEPPIEEPPAEEPPVDEPPADEPSVDEPAADEPSVDEPSVDEPPVVQTPIDEQTTTSSKDELTSSSTPSQSKSSKTSSTSSKKKKPSKDKDSSSKKQNTDDGDKKSQGQTQNQVTSYYTPSYDAGSMSDKWEGEETELEETNSVRELSKHLTNPKKELLKWIWLPILIALICIGALIYINVYVYGGKHTAFGKKENDSYNYISGDDFVYFDGDDEINAEEENYLQTEEGGPDDDPFSADNFFHFDNE